jgi:hypothetical protein
MSFRDDSDALAAQVDALTRELDELRPLRGENARLSAENARLSEENARLGKKIAGLRPPPKRDGRPEGKVHWVGAILALGAIAVMAFAGVMCGRSPKETPVVRPPEVMEKTPPPRETERDRLVVLGQLRLRFLEIDLPLRLALAGDDMLDVERLQKRQESFHVYDVRTLEKARAVYDTAAAAALAALPAGDEARTRAFVAASDALRREMRVLYQPFEGRQHRFGGLALRFVELALDEETTPGQLHEAHSQLVLALWEDRDRWAAEPQILEHGREILAAVDKQGHGGLTPALVHPLRMMQMYLEQQHAGGLRPD